MAADKVKEIAKEEGLEGQGLRLRVIGGGCAGFQYDLFFEEEPTSMDETFESRGIKLYVDPLSFQYLDGTEIDFVETVLGAGFKFRGVIITRYRNRVVAREAVEEVKNFFGPLVFKTVIPENIKVEEAHNAHIPVAALDKNCKAAQAFRNLTKDVLL